MDYGKLLYEYQNGNVKTTIYEDGTKIREWEDGEAPYSVFPENCDVKITNFCDFGSIYENGELIKEGVCPYCHEMSNKNGIHGDLELILDVWKNQQPGTEMAIGGGNPLAHPDIHPFLVKLKDRGILSNMTVNMLHMKRFVDTIRGLQNDDLIKGLGISYRGIKSLEVLPDTIQFKNTVFHLIMGIHTLKDVQAIISWCKSRKHIPKLLLLGYKTVGNGIGYYGPEVQENINQWESNWIHKVMKYHGIVLSFDNLALDQLQFKTKVSKSTWDELWMGEEGSVTMFVDAVQKNFALSSTSSIRYPLTNDTNLVNMMKIIHNERKLYENH